ncbi:MAG: four helix bundle suffix domain-containing protein [Lentisphaeria bacterium]|nr:four helix bundle suffix domain-containing protein [Lentisphaeria bacterium]
MQNEMLTFTSGGYRRLASFQVSQLIYDLTVIFVKRFVDPKSRTCDQMVQAARSGVQNIAEGSAASATSKKIELVLTNVARASLEELLNDYMDFLRQRDISPLPPQDPIIREFRQLHIKSIAEFRNFVNQTSRSEAFFASQSPSCRAAQLLITLINQAQYLLHHQINRLQADFIRQGGFSEKMKTMRAKYRPQSEN